jgi:hypothetical protein
MAAVPASARHYYLCGRGAGAFFPCDPLIEGFDCGRERHCKVKIAARNMEVHSVGDQCCSDQIRKLRFAARELARRDVHAPGRSLASVFLDIGAGI